MDWQVAEEGLKALVVALTGVQPHLVAWDMAPVGQRTYPQLDLRFFDHRARDGMTPEVTYPDPVDPETDPDVQPVVEAQRACSWSITCTTRDQRPNGKAYVLLDALAVLLELPYSLERIEALGLAVLDPGRVIPNTDRPRDHRDESEATLTLQLGYVLCLSVPDGVEDSGMSTIEHAEIGGTAIHITDPIEVPPEIIPPL